MSISPERHTPRERAERDAATQSMPVVPADEPVAAAPVEPATTAVPADPVVVEERVRDRFGGVNLGACGFGWIVAIGVSVLLGGLVGVVVGAVSEQTDFSLQAATDDLAAGTITTTAVASAAVLVLVLAIGYYAGGYVAGRMSRFDGGRQGAAVWVLGLLITLVAVVVGAIFGEQFNVLQQIELPQVTFEEVGVPAIVLVGSAFLATLLAAIAGGSVGRRYHDRVDRALAPAARTTPAP